MLDSLLIASVAGATVLAASAFTAKPPFRINVLDAATGRGVPLTKLTTPGYVSFYTDSAGVVAFDEPGMLGIHVFINIVSDGYVNSYSPPGSPQPGVLLLLSLIHI